MEENAVLDKLGLFGLTRQEATIYLCLYRNGELTGYEVAKYTGISRSNVYSGLSGLADKGAAYLVEGNASKYVAVPIERFCENKIRSLNDEKQYLIKNVPAMKEKEVGYITITGSRNIRDKMIEMLNEAEKRVYFSASLAIIEELKEEFLKVLNKKIKLVFITDGRPEDEVIYRDAVFYIGGDRGNNIRMIIDSEYALTGEITGKRDDTCLYTGQENFIRVFKEALRNEMKLIELTEGEIKNE
ncbi:MAG: TrmB family transcriptional regulator [Lachnospiraceae bacterium]|nr:TrmB family transcriptional regulator [Lachnospiraceae bacterium]